MKKFSEPALIAAIVLLMLVSVIVNVGPHIGLLIGNIGSGSMIPTLNIGTMIVAQKVAPEQLQVNDIIVYQPTGQSQNYICHRIVSITRNSPLAFTTKGDNYTRPDPVAVSADSVIGRVNLHLPALGYFVQFLKSGMGLVLCLVVPALIIVALCLRSIWRELFKVLKSNRNKA